MNRREPILGLRSLSSGPVDAKSSLIRPPPACDPAPHRVGRRFVTTSRKSRIAPWSVSACGRYGASTRHPTVSPNRPGSGGGSDPRKGGVMPAPRKYPNELGERARRMVAESMSEDPALTRNGAVKRIGPRVGAVPDTLSGWVKQAAIDAGQRPGVLFVDVRRARSGVAPICRVLSQYGVPIARAPTMRPGPGRRGRSRGRGDAGRGHPGALPLVFASGSADPRGQRNRSGPICSIGDRSPIP